MMNNTTLLLSSMMNESSSSNYSNSSSSSSIGTDTMTMIPIPIPTSHHKKRGTNIIIINIIFDVLKSSELMALQKLIQLPSSTTDIYDYHVHSEIPMDNIQNTIFVTHHRYQNNNDHDHLTTTTNTNNAKTSKQQIHHKMRFVTSSFEYLKARILGVMVVKSKWLTSSWKNDIGCPKPTSEFHHNDMEKIHHKHHHHHNGPNCANVWWFPITTTIIHHPNRQEASRFGFLCSHCGGL